MDRSCHHCDEFSRASLLRRGAAEAGRGLPAIEPGMPRPRERGSTGAVRLRARSGWRSRSTGSGSSALFEEGIAQAASGPAQPVLVSVFLPGGADSLSVLYPVARPELPASCDPKLALPDVGRTAVRRGPAAALAPVADAARDAARRGQGLASCRRSATTHPDQSHFTSRHFWEVGATDARLATGWMGRYLDHAGTKDNPLQGLSLDDQLQPSLASAKVPVAAVAGPTTTASGRRASGARSRSGCCRRWRRSARGAPTRPEPGGQGGGPVGQAPPPARAVRAGARTASAAPSPTRRATTPSRTGWPASRRCSARACRCTASR